MKICTAEGLSPAAAKNGVAHLMQRMLDLGIADERTAQALPRRKQKPETRKQKKLPSYDCPVIILRSQIVTLDF